MDTRKKLSVRKMVDISQYSDWGVSSRKRFNISVSLVLEFKVNTTQTSDFLACRAANAAFKIWSKWEYSNSLPRGKRRGMSYCACPVSPSKHISQVNSLTLSSELETWAWRGEQECCINGTNRYHMEHNFEYGSGVSHDTQKMWKYFVKRDSCLAYLYN